MTGFCKNFVLGAAQQAAQKTLVGFVMAERGATERMLLLEGQDRAPQRSDGLGARIVHVTFQYAEAPADRSRHVLSP